MDTNNDKTMLLRARIKIPDECHVDIQDLYMIKDPPQKDGMGDLAERIIHPSYKELKNKFDKAEHDYWEWKPMTEMRLHYVALDGYMSYELYRRIIDMKIGLLRGIYQEEFCPRCKAANADREKRLASSKRRVKEAERSSHVLGRELV